MVQVIKGERRGSVQAFRWENRGGEVSFSEDRQKNRCFSNKIKNNRGGGGGMIYNKSTCYKFKTLISLPGNFQLRRRLYKTQKGEGGETNKSILIRDIVTRQLPTLKRTVDLKIQKKGGGW